MCSTAARGQAPPAPVFDPPVKFICTGQPNGLAAADMDLDGDLDVAVSAFSGSVWILENKGPAAWAFDPSIGLKTVGHVSVPTLCITGSQAHPYDLTFGQFGLAGSPPDGYPDLAVAVDKAHVVWYLRNTVALGTVPFVHDRCETLIPLFDTFGIAAADFDGNAYDDVVVAASEFVSSQTYPRLAVLWNTGPGTFSRSIINVPAPLTGSGYDLDLIYVGGVGSSTLNPIDVAMSDWQNARVHIFKNAGGGVINYHASPAGVKSRGITAATLNSGDGDWDVATCDYSPAAPKVRWHKGLGGGNLIMNAVDYDLPTNAYSRGVDSGMINDDDWIDVVVANEGSSGFPGNVSVFINNNGNESALFVPRYDFSLGTPDPGPVQVLLADLNGDGFLDVITANSREDTISVLINGL